MPKNDNNSGPKHPSTVFSEYPDYFARFYDMIYHQLRDNVDNNFYLKKIRETEGRVLEIGVGTGRLFTDALNHGADIYGIDISPAMLKVISNKLSSNEQKRVSLQNIVDFDFPRKFDLIVAPFRVFMHLTDKSDQMTALNNVCNHLTPGGVFIFDVFVPDLKALLKGIDNVTDFDKEYEPGNRIKRVVTTKPDLMSQIINITFRFEWNDKDDFYSREWKSSLRYFFRFELEHLIERSKFKDYNISGDFDGNELGPESKEFIISCRK
jgi:SAM-dependent methyltransferase